MKPSPLTVLLLACATVSMPCRSGAEPVSSETPFPSAQQLLQDVRASLPREPLRISGELLVRRRHGLDSRRYGFEAELRLGDSPASAQYRIFDDRGVELEALTAALRLAEAPDLAYTAGGVAAEAPPLSAAIQSTDLTWMDLTLSFLWWHGGTVLREEEIKGRACYVVELPAPGGSVTVGGSGYAGVWLWVDAELHMLLQAEGREAQGQPLRRLWIKSLKKIDDRWMIKDMEVEKFPTTQRTKLHVREVETTE
ncbi:MAG: outer membrane lipoprotein-sorting protein [Lysobacterales bacterium]|nr:MAG: outer membrane lipoprotein-sorting protein [Xanthomonadales bacterium]